jgi:hypothetical protein
LRAWCDVCDVNKLYLNVRKCKVISSSSAKVQVIYDYSLNGQNLQRVSVIRDLGVLMVARQMLGFIMRIGRDFQDPYLCMYHW